MQRTIVHLHELFMLVAIVVAVVACRRIHRVIDPGVYIIKPNQINKKFVNKLLCFVTYFKNQKQIMINITIQWWRK